MVTPIDISKIKEFNKTKDIDIFKFFLEKAKINNINCINCFNPIIYYDTKIGTRNFKISGKSSNSFKIVNGKKYNLVICESCLTDKFTDYQMKNKSRVFNQMNKFSKFAFSIDDIDYEIQRNFYILTTEKNLIRKYGKTEGIKRWELYKNKQKQTNSFEYKSKKFGWNINDFNDYNNSRSVTLKNMVKRHGEKLGNELWGKYIERQSLTKSKKYYIDKYSEEKWEFLCKSKAHTYENYIKWYGSEDIALSKIKDRHNMWKSVSKSSQKYLKNFDIFLKSKVTKLKTYYDSINKEYMIITKHRKIYYLDYYIKDWEIAIEYNGDLFHANPSKYIETDEPIPGSNMKSSEIWKKDSDKIKTIESERNIKIIVIWESDLPSFENLLEKIYEIRKN